jgi:hypothetical protein
MKPFPAENMAQRSSYSMIHDPLSTIRPIFDGHFLLNSKMLLSEKSFQWISGRFCLGKSRWFLAVTG